LKGGRESLRFFFGEIGEGGWIGFVWSSDGRGWDFIAGSGWSWRDGVERGEEESRYGTGDDDGEEETVAEEKASGDTEMRRRVMPLGIAWLVAVWGKRTRIFLVFLSLPIFFFFEHGKGLEGPRDCINYERWSYSLQ
jgi:hypothetical protein